MINQLNCGCGCEEPMMVLKVEFLKKLAVYGAVASISGCSILYYMLQRKLAASGYYTKSLDALKNHATALKMLGEPIRVQFLKLNDTRNRIDEQKAKVLIPVSGTRSAGFLYSESTHTQGAWELDYVVLEFKGRPQTLVILAKQDKNNT